MAAPSMALALDVRHTPRPGLCALVMAGGDLIAVAIAMVAAVLARYAFDGRYDLGLYFRLAGLLVLFGAGYAVYGLYPGIGLNAVRELRQLTLATTLVFILLATLLFLFKEGRTYSRLVFVISWLLALALVPLMRAQVRAKFGHERWWGYPVVVFGSGEAAERLVEGLRREPEHGLHPVAVFQPGASRRGAVRGVPVLGDFHAAPLHARRHGLTHAVIALPDIPGPELVELLEGEANMFSTVYVIPGIAGFSTLGIEARDVGGMLALQLRRSLLFPSSQVIKRVVDFSLSLAIGIVLLPLLLLIAFIIRLESKGGSLYCHKRVGHGGRQFAMWKFRSMYQNGAEILEKYLQEHPEERQEWDSKQKLRNDPRVTRVGRFLRKTSLDEFPQLWNVLRGEMSLVGPRPIVGGEVQKYAEFFDLYCRVTPGLTGLWQVSGRSNTDYARRVELDSFYVRNWSPWFDIYLLSRTFRVVLKGEGAY